MRQSQVSDSVRKLQLATGLVSLPYFPVARSLAFPLSSRRPAHSLTPSRPNSLRDLIIAGPAPAPLARAESNYRYQIMLRTRQMSALSKHLANLTTTLQLPEDVSLSVDIDPVNLS